MLTYKQGDIFEYARNGCMDVLVHGCNCFNTMGAGIALKIAKLFPTAVQADRQTTCGDREKLGFFTKVDVVFNGHPLIIVNAYTQYRVSRRADMFEYEAFEDRLLPILENRFQGKRIWMPKIGAGLAGGDWKRIAAIIEASPLEITVVEYVPQ